jgi:hypothetical protein
VSRRSRQLLSPGAWMTWGNRHAKTLANAAVATLRAERSALQRRRAMMQNSWGGAELVRRGVCSSFPILACNGEVDSGVNCSERDRTETRIRRQDFGEYGMASRHRAVRDLSACSPTWVQCAPHSHSRLLSYPAARAKIAGVRRGRSMSKRRSLDSRTAICLRSQAAGGCGD